MQRSPFWRQATPRFSVLFPIVLLGAFALVAGLASLLGDAPRAGAQDGPTAPRYHEGLALTFDDAPALAAAFLGASIDDLYAYAYDGSAWRRIALQVDEREGLTGFVAEEDGQVDGDDELAWLYADAGPEAPMGDAPASMARAQAAAAIAVEDPLREGEAEAVRWIYLFHAPAGTDDPSPEALVRFDEQAREVTTADYVLGFASSAPEDDGFFGIKRISLSGDIETDLVDRTKFRADIDFAGTQLSLTEENLSNVLGQFGGAAIDFDIKPIKGGPVRAILSAAGGSAWPRRAALTAATGVADGLPGGGGPIAIPITGLKLTLDLNRNAATAGATYSDSNLVEPVPIDGMPDAVPGSPPPAWRELRLPTASALLLAGTVDVSSTVRAFYADDESGLEGDTGDGRSIGEHGVTAEEIGDLFGAGFPGEMVVVPTGEQGPTAEQLLDARAQPLTVRVDSVSGGPPEPTATPTPTPTPEAQTFTVHLPWSRH